MFIEWGYICVEEFFNSDIERSDSTSDIFWNGV